MSNRIRQRQKRIFTSMVFASPMRWRFWKMRMPFLSATTGNTRSAGSLSVWMR